LGEEFSLPVWRRREFIGAAAALVLPPPAHAGYRGAATARPRSLDGRANNPWRRDWGRAGSAYRRVARPRYADGAGAMMPGPSPRYISNRIFNSLGVDLFSERNVSQLVWAWGQAIDHTIGLARGGSERADIPLRPGDPLESFPFDVPAIPFTRDAAAPGSGTAHSPRRPVNTISSVIDASSIYGCTGGRLGWLREGAELLLPGGYLPTAAARGDAARAPDMQALGRLAGHRAAAVVAGDVRANENSALTALQTLFAREHNRIVARLPHRLPPEARFQIARRIVGAELQHITFHEFLPAVGVHLGPYRGYRSSTRPELLNEFAAAGYRSHSMVNGEVHVLASAGRYAPEQTRRLAGMNVTIRPRGNEIELTVPQSAAFFNPALLETVGLGPMLAGLAGEPGYRNDEQIDDALRSILFEIPGAGGRRAIVDLGAIDIQRGRDAGMPCLNDLRAALGLPRHRSFTALTGERSAEFGPGFGADPINHPGILRYVSLRDLDGRPVAVGDSRRRAVSARRASTLAARLRAIYGTVDEVEAFVGMVCEPNLPGSELGETQMVLWRRQFQALRDGDRYCCLADPELGEMHRRYGIDYRVTLAELIARNTDVRRSELPANVFFAPPPDRATPVG
jgi:hypothetical protein